MAFKCCKTRLKSIIRNEPFDKYLKKSSDDSEYEFISNSTFESNKPTFFDVISNCINKITFLETHVCHFLRLVILHDFMGGNGIREIDDTLIRLIFRLFSHESRKTINKQSSIDLCLRVILV